MKFWKIGKDISESWGGSKRYHFNDACLYNHQYPLDLSFTLLNEEGYYSPKDEAGLPLKKYDSVGVQYNPTRIAAYGLANFNKFQETGNQDAKAKFFIVADWFADSATGRYEYGFSWGELRAPWISCMAQGQALSVLYRAYLLSKNEKYLDNVDRIIHPLSLSIADGGVRSTLYGSPFLEEYPTSVPKHTLNGFLYALIGVVEMVNIKHDVADRLSLDDLIVGLEVNLFRWDINGWSSYDLHESGKGIRNACTPAYHNIHSAQLRYIGTVCNRPTLLGYSDRWRETALRRGARLSALVLKVKYRLQNRAQR